MKGAQFPEANMKLLPPEGHEDEVYALPIWRHPEGGMVISKWEMTWRERWSCLWNGHIWFHCWGNTHPPMTLETSYPFEPGERKTVPLWLVLVTLASLMAITTIAILYFSESF